MPVYRDPSCHVQRFVCQTVSQVRLTESEDVPLKTIPRVAKQLTRETPNLCSNGASQPIGATTQRVLEDLATVLSTCSQVTPLIGQL